MSLFRTILGRKSTRFVLVALAVMAVACAWLAWRNGLNRAALDALWGDSKVLLEAHPVALFVALAVLPGLPFPVSLLIVAAGVVWHDHPFWACVLTMTALALNMTWTYWVAAYPARRLVERVIRSTRWSLPDLPRQNHVRLILVMRLTPGIPLFFQNYLLGVLRPPFRLYLPLSILLLGPMNCGLVLLGAGATDGRFAPALTGIALVVVAVTLTKWLRAWLERRKAAALPDPAAEI